MKRLDIDSLSLDAASGVPVSHKGVAISDLGDTSGGPDTSRTLRFDFASLVTMKALTFHDVADGAILRPYDVMGAAQPDRMISASYNGHFMVDIRMRAVSRLDVVLLGDAKLQNVIFDETTKAPKPVTDVQIIAVSGAIAKVGRPVRGSEGGLFVVAADGEVTFDAADDFADLEEGKARDTSVFYTILNADGSTEISSITFTVGGEANAAVLQTPQSAESTTEDAVAKMMSADADVSDLLDTDLSLPAFGGVAQVTADGDAQGSGTVFFKDGSYKSFDELAKLVPCFTPGTLIATPRGERPIETLKAGDRVITRDNGIQEIVWYGQQTVTGKELIETPSLRPILIKRGALGQGVPERDMMVSPDHRMLVTSGDNALYFEGDEVFVAAETMVGADGIHAVDVVGTCYLHFMCEHHQVVLANGVWTESFQPSLRALGSMSEGARKEILNLFPDLATEEGQNQHRAARRGFAKIKRAAFVD